MVVLGALGLCSRADAWELGQVEAKLSQQVQYNDNIALNSTNPQAVFGYWLNPMVRASGEVGDVDLTLNANGNIRRNDAPEWDCENYSVSMNSRYATPTGVFSLDGSHGVSCAYSQLIEETGILVPRNQMTMYNVSPTWAWLLSPRSQVSVNASYRKAAFSGQNASSPVPSVTNSNLRGNDAYSLNLEYSYVWDRRTTLNGGLLFSHIQYSGPSALTQRMYGFQAGGRYAIDQHWNLNLSAGLRFTQSSVDGLLSFQGGELSTNYVADARLSYAGAGYEINAGYSSRVMPSALGQTLQTQSVFADYTYQLSRSLSLTVDGGYIHSQPIAEPNTLSNVAGYERDYFKAGLGLAWQPAQSWTVKLMYNYRWQKLKTQENSAEANLIMLSLGYDWDGVRY